MIGAEPSWWDHARTVGGYLAPVLFLVLGSALTILASLLAESGRHRRERERRSEEWQRQTLLDLQALVSTNASRVMDQANRWWLEVQNSGGAMTLDDVATPDLLRPLVEDLDAVVMLGSRVLDDPTRELCLDFADSAAALLFNKDMNMTGTLTDALGPSFRAANARLGELLRTSYG